MDRINWLLILIFCLTASGKLCAQNFSGGLLGGFAASQVEGDKYSGFNQLGFTGGMWVRLPIQNQWALQGEIRYTQKGSKRNAKPKQSDYTSYSMKLGYIELPALVRFDTQKRFGILAGLTPGYLMHSEEKDEYGKISDELIPNKIKSFDLASTVGIQVQLMPNIHFDLRWSYSLIPIRNLAGDGPYWFDGGQHNNWLSTCICYQFK